MNAGVSGGARDSDSGSRTESRAHSVVDPRDGLATTLDGGGSDELDPELQALIEAKVRQRLFAQNPAKTHIGRFVVLEEIGRGGMGTVYAAYDEQLDRKVAVKVMQAEHSAANARQRFQREAQAMARLSHPNVITVHEVSESDDLVFMAMEFIRGQSIDAWIRTEPQWPEVLEVFVQAGRGIMAAHEAGLVHRDLKPHNIMRGEDGTVKVLDFGLARAWSEEPEEPPEPSGSGSVLASPLTQTGALVGTPAYMAPEQFRAQPADARSDQFSFCVTLFEALYGERPYESSSSELPSALMSRSTSRGARLIAPTRARVPKWLHRVLERGLEPDPRNRWPSMAALLRALDRGPRRTRRRRWVAGAVVAILALGALQQRRAHTQRERLATCEAEGAAIDEIWNDEQRAQLSQGLLATGAGFAQRSVDTLTPWLDEYRDAWRSGRIEACVRGSIEHTWDETLLDRSAWCFEDRRLQFEATVQQIATATPKAARRAVRLASYLDPVETCLDPVLLRRLPTPPSEVRDEVRAIRALLTESDHLRHAGRYAWALEVARLAIERTEPLGWPPLLANARFIEGRCLRDAGRFSEAEQSLTRAYFEAQAAGAPEVAFRAARSLMMVLSSLQRYREAEVWAQHADVLALTLTDPKGLDEAEGHYLRMYVYLGLGDYRAAAEAGERALSMRSEALGADHPITAAAMRNLARVYLEQERFAEALELFERALEIWTNAVGSAHPYIGELSVLRGEALVALGRVDEGLSSMEEGLSSERQALRPGHPKLARDLTALGRAYLARSRVDEAEPLLEEAWTIWREQAGPRNHLAAGVLLDLADVARHRGEPEEALRRCTESLELLEGVIEPGHPAIARTLARMADLHREIGPVDVALERRRDALIRRESALAEAPTTHDRVHRGAVED